MQARQRRQERAWEKLNAAAARARAAIVTALASGIADRNAAEILSLQRAFDLAEERLVSFERKARRRRSQPRKRSIAK